MKVPLAICVSCQPPHRRVKHRKLRLTHKLVVAQYPLDVFPAQSQEGLARADLVELGAEELLAFSLRLVCAVPLRALQHVADAGHVDLVAQVATASLHHEADMILVGGGQERHHVGSVKGELAGVEIIHQRTDGGRVVTVQRNLLSLSLRGGVEALKHGTKHVAPQRENHAVARVPHCTAILAFHPQDNVRQEFVSAHASQHCQELGAVIDNRGTIAVSLRGGGRRDSVHGRVHSHAAAAFHSR
mmetsp:Transcript_20699/g.53026  ORF Transcript_20699/g.53026 Transcript_20699/m.53026 type:complete len:244 (+) Transcript_20699:915-1646(+)